MKSTLASQFPSPLLLAFEVGYNALAGVYAQDVTSWADMKKICRELKKPEVQNKFKTIIIDTVDISAQLAEKYILSQHGVDTVSQIPFGQGWTYIKRELEQVFRGITQLGYSLVFIGHSKEKTFKRIDGTEYNQIAPSLGNSFNEIIKNMVDIYGYCHSVLDKDGQSKRVITLRSLDGTIDCGCRFRYVEAEIDLSYDALVKAINEAIDKENGDFVTDSKIESQAKVELDFDSLMNKFTSLIAAIPGSSDTAQTTDEGKHFAEYYAPRITEVIERYLGKGKKISQIDRTQVELLDLINLDIEELIGK